MPKGQAAVRWSPELDRKLLLTIIAVQNIKVDYNAVAKAFGDGIPGSCIETRMRALRTKAKGISGPSSSSSNQSSPATAAAVKSGGPVTPIKRIREPTASSSSTPKKRGKTNKGIIKAEESDDESLLADTPPSSSDGGQQEQAFSPTTTREEPPPQARISPRNLAKKNYKDLTDPFIKLNSDHQNLFEDTKSGSEDSVGGSDGEFEVPKSANNNTLETEPLFC